MTLKFKIEDSVADNCGGTRNMWLLLLYIIIQDLAHRARKRDTPTNQNGPRTMIPVKLENSKKRPKNEGKSS